MEEFPWDSSKNLPKFYEHETFSNYDDLYVTSKKVAEEQERVADEILNLVEQYLNNRI